MRFVDGEDLRDDLIDFEPGIADRDAFQGLVFRTRQGAAPFRFVGLGSRKGGEESDQSRGEWRRPLHVYASSNSIFLAEGSSLVILNLRI
jgi:hypothetical protein